MTIPAKLTCRCGKPVNHVEPYLADVCEWICRDCATPEYTRTEVKRKTCRTCLQSKTYDQFPSDGNGNVCKKCYNAKLKRQKEERMRNA